MTSNRPESLDLKPLAPYEDRLLNALAFFRTQRDNATQARHCLSMYLRQSEARIMSEVSFYAQEVGVSDRELLELIYQDPNQAQSLIQDKLGMDIFKVFADE
ncbi:MAG: hypothetical protein R6U67_04720 [Sodalinema sp.]|uniref:hypothetical protein n=1 Tax=Sodalinema sp. TaxID=3080550 RepID=UPI00120773C4|nr:MAG: hypothetical protein EYR95_00200 [Phormidium sp. SL48-SHIP]